MKKYPWHTVLFPENDSDAMADSLVDYMRIEDVPKDIINDMNLVFQELFANAYQHGNKEDDSKRIEAGVCVGKGEVSLYVEDEGEGFDPSKVDFLLDPDKMYGERGRGLYLVKGLADEIEFNDKGNRVTVRKKINLTGGIH